MELKQALQTVIELAEQNVIDDPDMKEERTRQLAAIRRVSKLVPVL